MRATLLLTLAACGFQSRAGAPSPTTDVDGGVVTGDATPLDGPSFTPCPGYLSLGVALEPSSYRVVTTPARFKDAELTCQAAQGGHLVILDSDLERTTVANAVANSWVGFSDLKNEGQWIDIAGRSSSYMYAQWASSEPSTNNNDNCAYLGTNGLDARDCGQSDGGGGESHAYVCECDGIQGMTSSFFRPPD